MNLYRLNPTYMQSQTHWQQLEYMGNWLPSSLYFSLSHCWLTPSPCCHLLPLSCTRRLLSMHVIIYMCLKTNKILVNIDKEKNKEYLGPNDNLSFRPCHSSSLLIACCSLSWGMLIATPLSLVEYLEMSKKVSKNIIKETIKNLPWVQWWVIWAPVVHPCIAHCARRLLYVICCSLCGLLTTALSWGPYSNVQQWF